MDRHNKLRTRCIQLELHFTLHNDCDWKRYLNKNDVLRGFLSCFSLRSGSIKRGIAERQSVSRSDDVVGEVNKHLDSCSGLLYNGISPDSVLKIEARSTKITLPIAKEFP